MHYTEEEEEVIGHETGIRCHSDGYDCRHSSVEVDNFYAYATEMVVGKQQKHRSQVGLNT